MLCQSSQVQQVYLKGSFALIQQRLQQRQGHYMKANLLQSQFDTLEEPAEAVWVDIAQSPEAIVAQIRASVGCLKGVGSVMRLKAKGSIKNQQSSFTPLLQLPPSAF